MREITTIFQDLGLDVNNCCLRGHLVEAEDGVYLSLDEPQSLALEDAYRDSLICDVDETNAETAIFTTSLTSTKKITSALSMVHEPDRFIKDIVVINLDVMKVAKFSGVVSLRYSDAPGDLNLSN